MENLLKIEETLLLTSDKLENNKIVNALKYIVLVTLNRDNST